MEYDGPKTMIGRILSEVSWTGKNVKGYRDGGAGYENVLTAEVFQLLDFLPRSVFLNKVLQNVNMLNGNKYKISTDNSEKMNLDILPGNYYLKEKYNSHQTGMPVQPDGILESDELYIMLEAKRIKSSSFQPQQLAKEFYLMTREMQDKKPLLLIVLGKKPPVLIKGKGRRAIADDILLEIDSISQKANYHPLTNDQIESLVKDSVGWITWDEVLKICKEQLTLIDSDNSTYTNSIKRMVQELDKVVKRHS